MNIPEETFRMPEVQSLIARIPRFSCRPGCSDCCLYGVLRVSIYPDGILTFTGGWYRIGKIGTIDQYGTCCRCAEGVGCTTYKNRGFLCRLYGASEMFPDCPYGYGAEKKLTIEETQAIVKEVQHLELF